MAAHPAVLGVVEAVLGQQLLHSADGPAQHMRWRVHVHETIPKDDGPAQQLHRDGDLSLLEFDNELEHAIGVIWALDDDFTDERGTTRVVLGSRHWQTGHPQPAPEDSV